jgi:hypothetical protein
VICRFAFLMTCQMLHPSHGGLLLLYIVMHMKSFTQCSQDMYACDRISSSSSSGRSSGNEVVVV